MRSPRKEIKRKINKVKIYYLEWLEENNSSISFKDWFITVLQYTEDDLRYFTKSIKTIKKKANKVRERKITSIDPHLPLYIGDRENPEYNKYFSIVCEQRKYNMEHPGAGVSLKNYLISTYNFSEEESKFECKKIEHILYCKNKK